MEVSHEKDRVGCGNRSKFSQSAKKGGTMVSKRIFLLLSSTTALVIAALAIHAQSVSDTSHSNTQRLEGTFLVDVTPDLGGPPPFKVIRHFTPVGGVVGPSQVLLGSTVCGEWIRNRTQ